MLRKIDAQPRGVDRWIGGNVRLKLRKRHPAGFPDLIGIDGDLGLAVADVNVDDFVLCQAIADIGAIFDLLAPFEFDTRDAEFFLQAAVRAMFGAFTPMRMRAAGVRPETGRVVLARRAALEEDTALRDDENADRRMAQATTMHLEFVKGTKVAFKPSWYAHIHMPRYAKLPQDYPALTTHAT